MNIENVRLFASLTEEKRHREAKIKALNEQLAELEMVIVNDFLLEGITNISTDNKTVYLRESIHISQQLPGPEIAAKLTERGYSWLVGVNHSAVRSAIKEDGEEPFDDLFNVETVQRLSVRTK